MRHVVCKNSGGFLFSLGLHAKSLVGPWLELCRFKVRLF